MSFVLHLYASCTLTSCKIRVSEKDYLADCSGHQVDPPKLHHCPHQSQSMSGPTAAQWLHCHGPV